MFFSGRNNADHATKDCLTLDIYRPQSATNIGILFWIHGGAFITGDSSIAFYDGLSRAMNNYIVVNIQYRLSVFGFLNMFDESTGKTIGGNYGLMDQQLALKYVHANAVNMGGDPGKIVINGESAGGMSVALHLLNPESGKGKKSIFI